jgi:hypothetical protein
VPLFSTEKNSLTWTNFVQVINVKTPI